MSAFDTCCDRTYTKKNGQVHVVMYLMGLMPNIGQDMYSGMIEMGDILESCRTGFLLEFEVTDQEINGGAHKRSQTCQGCACDSAAHDYVFLDSGPEVIACIPLRTS